MNKDNMKNMVVLKDLPSNIVEEAIVILKPNVKIKKMDLAESKNNKNKQKKLENSKEYVINEAEMIVANYLSKIEKEKNNVSKHNKKIEDKYKRLKAISIFLGTMLFLTFLIK